MKLKIKKNSQNYCKFDKKKCTYCHKCHHVPPSHNFLHYCVIALLIIFICYLLTFQIIPLQIEHNLIEERNNNSITLEDKVANNNMQMSNNEREFREYYGLGNESIGENYNSMG